MMKKEWKGAEGWNYCFLAADTDIPGKRYPGANILGNGWNILCWRQAYLQTA